MNKIAPLIIAALLVSGSWFSSVGAAESIKKENKIGHGEKIFVTDFLGKRTTVIHANTGKIAAVISGSVTSGKCFAGFDDKLYLIDPLAIDVISADSYKIIDSIEYDGFPTPRHSKAEITPDGNKMYVGIIGWGDEVTSGVFVIDLKKKKQVRILEKNNIQRGFISLSENGKYLYVPALTGVKQIEVRTDKVVQEYHYEKYQWIRDVCAIENGIVVLTLVDTKNSKMLIDDKNKNLIAKIHTKSKKIESFSAPQFVDRLFYDPKREKILGLTYENLVEVDFNKKQTTIIIEGTYQSLGFSRDYTKYYLTDEINKRLMIYAPGDSKNIRRINLEDAPNELFVY